MAHGKMAAMILCRPKTIALFAALLAGCQPTPCEHDGKSYQHGETFAYDDGCNSCVCSGGSIACTEMDCSTPVADGGFADGGSAEGGFFQRDAGSILNQVVPIPGLACEVVSVNRVSTDLMPTPGDLVRLTARNLPPATSGATVASAQWSLVRIPAGSRAVLSTSRGMTTTLITRDAQGVASGVDLAGYYVLRVTVDDDQNGSTSHDCAVHYQPTPAVYIELIWDSTDADLDLHLLKQDDQQRFCAAGVPSASLGELTTSCESDENSCYFGNCQQSNRRQDWDGDGRPGSPADPQLTVTEGFAPEVIQIEQPVSGEYLLAGYYWPDNTGPDNTGPGDSAQALATLRIYLHGLLWAQYQRPMQQHHWWEIAQLKWPETTPGQVCLSDLQTGAQSCSNAPVCQPQGSCVQCRTSTGCSRGTRCATAIRRCVPEVEPCSSDRDCPLPLVCLPASDTCAQARCSDNDSCGNDSSMMCLDETRSCHLIPAICPEPDEPNNTIATATPVEQTGYTGLLCRDDLDMLQITAHQGIRLKVSVDVDALAGSPNTMVTLIGPHGLDIATREVNGYTGNATLATDVETTGVGDTTPYYLLLQEYDNTQDQRSYQVGVSEEAPLNCQSQPEEPNDTLQQSVDSVLSPGDHRRALCGAQDQDYYRIVVPSGLRLVATAAFDNNEGNINLALHNLNGTELALSEGVTHLERLSYADTDQQQTLVVRVFRNPLTVAEPDQGYTLSIVTAEPPECIDQYEPNESPAEAALVGSGTYNSNICNIVDQDYFQVDLPSQSNLSVTTSFTHAEGDIDMLVFDGSGEEIGRSESTEDREHVLLRDVAEGTYIVYIYPWDNTEPLPDRQTYTLAIGVD